MMELLFALAVRPPEPGDRAPRGRRRACRWCLVVLALALLGLVALCWAIFTAEHRP